MSELTTPRLVLRRFTGSDDELAALMALDADPLVVRYADPQYVDAPPDAATVRGDLSDILAGYERGQEFWAAIERDGEAFAGWFFLELEDDPDAWELGYRLRREAWGRGLATEGARAVLEHAFGTLGVARVYAEIVAVNAGSLRVVEKLGFRHVSDGEWEGMADRRYELEREDWTGCG